MYKAKKFEYHGDFWNADVTVTAQEQFNEWASEMGDKIEIINVAQSDDGKTISVVYIEK